MKLNSKFNILFAVIWMSVTANTARGEESALVLHLPDAAISHFGNARFVDSRHDLLALNENGIARDNIEMTAAPTEGFQPPLFSGSKVHQYLGLGTVLMVGLTALTAPEEGCEHNCPAVSQPRQTSGTTHTRLARTAAALAAATVTTGLLYHWDDFHLEDGLSDPDNQHVMLGTAGALLMLLAVNKSMKSNVPTSHAGYAELGGVAMAVAIKLTW